MNQKLKIKNREGGVTLIEIIITIVIVGILSTIVAGAFAPATGREALDKKTAIVLSLLEQARNQTLSAKGGKSYGVHFEATKAVLFSGPTYSTADTSNVTEPVSPLVTISGINLSGGGNYVIFERLTGETNQAGTVTISLAASTTQQKIITISATGISSGN